MTSRLASSSMNPGRLRGWKIKWFVYELKLCVAVWVYTWLVNSGKLNISAAMKVDPGGALLLVFLTLPALAIPAMRWRALLKCQEIEISLWAAIRITWAGYFATLILPGAAAGDGVKALMLSILLPRDRIRALTSIFVDRAIGLYSLLLLTTFTGVFPQGGSKSGWTMEDPAVWFNAALLTATLVFAAIMTPVVRRKITTVLPESLRTTWKLYQYHKKTVAKCLGYSLCSNSLTILSLMAAFHAIGSPVGVPVAFKAGSLSLIASCLPLTPGGLGIGEAGAETAFGWYGFTGGAEAMLLVRLATILWSLPGVLVSIGTADLNLRQK